MNSSCWPLSSENHVSAVEQLNTGVGTRGIVLVSSTYTRTCCGVTWLPFHVGAFRPPSRGRTARESLRYSLFPRHLAELSSTRKAARRKLPKAQVKTSGKHECRYVENHSQGQSHGRLPRGEPNDTLIQLLIKAGSNVRNGSKADSSR